MKKNYLDDKTIDNKIDLLMDKINHLENKKKPFNKIWILHPTFSIILTLIFVFAFSDFNRYSLTYNPVYHLEKVNAQEYNLTYDNDLILLNVLTLVENDQLIPFTEDLFYYNNFSKYNDISNRTQLDLVSIHDKEFLIVTIDERIHKYFNVYHIGHSILLNEIEYDFTNFNEEMTLMFRAWDEYPPELSEVNLKELTNNEHAQDIYIEQYQENPQFKESYPEIYPLYSWYINKLNETLFQQKLNTDFDENFRIEIYMNGTESHLGDINHITNSYSSKNIPFKNYQEIEFPVKINQCPLQPTGATWDDGWKIYDNEVLSDCTNPKYQGDNIVSLLIDFSSITNHFDINNYDITVHIEDLFTHEIKDFTITSDDVIVNGNKLYILPLPMARFTDLYVTYGLVTSFTVKDKIGNIILYKN